MGQKGNGQALAETATVFHFNLGRLRIGLWSDRPLVEKYAYQFLEGWDSLVREPEAAENCDIQIHLALVKTLPGLPEEKPVFAGERKCLPDGVGALNVYHTPAGLVFYFQDGGLVQLGDIDAPQPVIQGHVTIWLLKYGRLHDLLFTSLSPFLRRQGYYLVHASAAVPRQGNEAAIFVGEAGSGKTTTALNLALNGWQILSNDTLLLEERPDGIYALPTPGGFSIRPKSIAHLPALADYVPNIMPGEFYHLALSELGLSYAAPARIGTIYFPTISRGEDNEIRPLNSALALAHLMELSLDRWDTADLPTHIAFLEQLSRQAQTYSLKIGRQQGIHKVVNVKRK